MTALVKKNIATVSLQSNFTEEQINVIKNSIAKEATNEELEMFLYTCKRTGLDPFAKQLYFIKRYDSSLKKYIGTIQTSIDGFRAIASRNPEYAGQTTTLFSGKDGKWVELWTANEHPFAAKVGIYRKGFTEPTYAIAKWSSYVQKTKEGEITKMWNNFSDLMLGKCAEALALRKAFPNDLSGLYSYEEMSQAYNNDEDKNEKQTIKVQEQNEEKVYVAEVVVENKQKENNSKVIVQNEVIETLKNINNNNEKFNKNNAIQKEIFKKFMQEIETVIKIKQEQITDAEKKDKLLQVYVFFSEKSAGVPLSKLKDHILSIEKEFVYASAC
jgi:phage recombination protein Bet